MSAQPCCLLPTYIETLRGAASGRKFLQCPGPVRCTPRTARLRPLVVLRSHASVRAGCERSCSPCRALICSTGAVSLPASALHIQGRQPQLPNVLKDSQNYTGKTGAAKGCMCLSAVMIVSSTDQCLDQYADQFPVNRSRDKRQQRSVALNPPQPQVSACGTGSSGLFWWLCVRSPRRTTHGLKRRAGYGTT